MSAFSLLLHGTHSCVRSFLLWSPLLQRGSDVNWQILTVVHDQGNRGNRHLPTAVGRCRKIASSFFFTHRLRVPFCKL
jgi:hypothetical protein